MKGQVYKRCTKCRARARYGKGDRRCPKCGATVFTWYFKVDVGWSADGTRLQKKRGGFETKKAAERALRDVLAKFEHGRYVESSDLTVADYLRNEWLPAMKPPRLAEKTWRDYRLNVESYVIPRIGHLALQELNAAHLNRMYADLLADGKTQSEGGLSPTTVRSIHTQLHKALGDAIKWGRLERNATEHAQPPSARTVKARTRAAITTWTPEQVRAFLDHTRGSRRHPLWRLAIYTGMRRSELLGLRWQDIDFQRNQLSVVNTVVVVENGEPIASERQKTAASRRTIELDERTIEVLLEHRSAQEQLRAEAGPAWQDSGLVFTNATGGCLYPNGVWQEFVEACEEAPGVPRIRMHDIRHTHATLLLQAGTNPKVVAERLGHASISFLLETYANVLPGMQRSALDDFDELVNETDGPREGAGDHADEEDA